MHLNPPRRGEIRWALVPYALEAPFEGPGWEGGIGFDGVERHARASRGGAIGLRVPAKMRPVLVLQSIVSAANGAPAVLRLKRLDALPARLRDEVLAGHDTHLVPLAAAIGGVRQIAMADTLERAHLSAIDHRVIGTATADELRLIGERVARVLELDLGRLVEDAAGDLLEQLRG